MQHLKTTDELYICLHEAGHAVVTYLAGGHVELMELISVPHSKGKARVTAYRPDDKRKIIACGGFAVEYRLYTTGRISDEDGQAITEEFFIHTSMNNASEDKIAYFGSNLRDETGRWPEEEDREFMGVGAALASKLTCYFPQIERLAQALAATRRLDRGDVERILGLHTDTEQGKN